MHPDSQSFLYFFPFFFPVFFVGIWLTTSALLGLLSGWWRLQARYPRGQESPILTLGQRSGMMGLGVAMSGILTLSACPSGLRVGIWRIFGPFQRPFLVPWSEIEAEPVQRFLMPMAKLTFGRPAVGKLTIDAASWARLSASTSAATAVGGAVPALAPQALARALFLQWIAIVVAAASFYYFVSRAMPGGPGVPLPICIGFPALVFGVSQFVRYIRQRPA